MKHHHLRFHAYIKLEKHEAKKNNRPIYKNKKTGKRFLGKSDSLKSTEHLLIADLGSRRNLCKIFSPIAEPVWCIFLFKFEKSKFYTKAGIQNKKLPDQSNLYQLPEDCLQKAGIIQDDGQIFSHDLSRRLPWHETALEIMIFTKLKDTNMMIELPIQPSGAL